MLNVDGYDQGLSGPSLHDIRQKAATAAWEKNRFAMLKTFIECNAMPSNQTCIMCASEANTDVYSVHRGHISAPTALQMLIAR